MKKYIVITSIFEPTEGIDLFSKMSGYELIVVGDKKSPTDWSLDNVDFIPVSIQEQMGFNLAEALPYNHYCRKMLGYLKAIEDGADLIVDTDDDNLPKENWSFPDFQESYDTIPNEKGFINIYQLYSKMQIWARGLPLKLITTQFNLESDLSKKEANVGVWQGLADEDPDVDAIYRLTSDVPCYFEDRDPVVLGAGTVSPFNTQNTIIKKELFPLLYLPAYVTFRFTDILRGLVAQPIMWLHGYQLGFTNATVVQKRNPHDYMKDFISEVPMYEHCETVIELVTGAIKPGISLSENLLLAYRALNEHSIVTDQEIVTLETWLLDLKEIEQRQQ